MTETPISGNGSEASPRRGRASRFGWSREQLRRIALLESSDHASAGPAERRVVFGAIRRARQHSLSLLGRGFMRDVSEHAAAGRMSPGVRTSAVLLKPVGDLCNLRCTYCYEGSGSERAEDARMTEATLSAIIRDMLAQDDAPVQFLWHGGEPLMAGLSFFRKGIELQREHNVNGCRIVNTVQTNGLLLDDRWIEFFRDHRFNVGISIDGTADLHNHFRVDACGRGTFDGVVKAIRKLQENGFDVGAISVISPALAKRARDLFSTFRTLGLNAYDVHPNFGNHSNLAAQPLSPKAFSDFAIDLFDLWLAAGDDNIRIRLFDDLFQGLIGYSPSTCYFAGTCTGIMGFEANGDAVPCTRPFDRGRYTFGNIARESLTAIQQSNASRLFREEDLSAQANSRDCPWYSICHNGCPQHRMKAGRQDISGANYYCSCQSGMEGGYAAIFDHAVSRAEKILGLDPLPID